MESRDAQPFVRLAAVGDLLLADGPAESPGGPVILSAPIREIFRSCDVVLGNLECTLPGDGRTVATEPRVVSRPEWVRSIKDAGFNVVTLANNHMFDCLQAGFHRLRTELDDMGIRYFGAGDTLEQALAPVLLDVRGIRLAMLGAADRSSGPSQFATADQWGVAPLDGDLLIERIAALRGSVHHVIVCVHWGEERFLIPSPGQIRLAKAFIDAGASMVIGHHGHVVQGLQQYAGRPVAYSLGNFVARNVHYSDGDVLRWNTVERIGCILTANLGENDVSDVHQTATFDEGPSLVLDTTGRGSRRLDKANRAVARDVTPRRYSREYLWVKTVRPALGYLRWSKLKTLRLRQFKNALAGLAKTPKDSGQ